MEKRLLLLFIALFVNCILYSQGSMKLYLKNNDTLSGIGVIKLHTIKLKNNNQKGSKKIKFKDIDSAVVKTKEGDQTLYFFSNNKNKGIYYYLLEKKGSVNLYSKSNMTLTGYGAFENISYYIKRDSESEITILGGGTIWENFKREASEYFKDCPELVDKIKKSKKDFTKKVKDLKNIVAFYNLKCN